MTESVSKYRTRCCSCSRYEYSLSRAWQVVKEATKILTRPLSGFFLFEIGVDDFERVLVGEYRT